MILQLASTWCLCDGKLVRNWRRNWVSHFNRHRLRHITHIHTICKRCPENTLTLEKHATLTYNRRQCVNSVSNLISIRYVLIILPKKGDLKQCANYRTIALVSHASKILLRIILDRIRVKTETEIADEQAGFRQGRGTRGQITNLIEY